MDEQEVEVDLRLVLEVNDWDDVLLRDVLQERHHLEQRIVNLAKVLLQESERVRERAFSLVAAFLHLVL